MRLELAKITAPRSISPAQRLKILALLKPKSGQTYALSVATDSEPSALTCEIDSILKEAGWVQIAPFSGITTHIPCGNVAVNTLSGTHVRTHTDASMEVQGAGNLLYAALANAGLATERALDPANVTDTKAINLMVGIKPVDHVKAAQ